MQYNEKIQKLHFVGNAGNCNGLCGPKASEALNRGAVEEEVVVPEYIV